MRYTTQPDHGVAVLETPSRGADLSVAAPHLAVDVLERLQKRGVPRCTAFKSRIGLVARLRGKAATDLTIDEMYDIKPRLRQLLSNCKYAENSIEAYINDVTTLLGYADEMGWTPWANIPAAWMPVFMAAKEKRCPNICRYAVRSGKLPGEFTQDYVDQWLLERVQVRAWDYTNDEANRFIKVLAGENAWPKLDPRRQEDFGIPLEQMPQAVRTEILKLLSWKTAPLSQGRQRKQQIRQISARNIKSTFSALYGFAVNVQGVTPETVRELVSCDLMYAFVNWYLHVRGVAGKSAHVRLVCILALFRQHPDYRGDDVKWLKELIDNLPLEADCDLQERRAAKQVSFAAVKSIAKAVRRTRKQAAKKGPKKLAWVVQLELIVLWLTVLPWRQRNLRECRIGGKSPNLFKGPLRNTPGIAKPDWVEAELAENPDAEFWQFKFASGGETKNGRGVHGVLPHQLIPLLEEFLSEHRHHLLQGKATEELLVNTAGKRLGEHRLSGMIGEVTLRHIQKRVTPHTFRHIYAYAFLDDNPKDYLTLSKILWHKNVMVTIAIYGATFNESNGACAAERWLDSRKDD